MVGKTPCVDSRVWPGHGNAREMVLKAARDTLTAMPAVLGPGGSVPLRRPDSVRRTTTIEMHWPDGRGAPTHIVARGRDLLTRESGSASILAHAAIDGSAFITRQLIQVSDGTSDPRLAALAGIRAGGQLRAMLRELFPAAEERASLRFLLLDDLAGATLVSSWGWFAWDGYTRELADRIHQAGIGGKEGNMAGVCIGFAAGSSALDASGRPHIDAQKSNVVEPLEHPGDPGGWHDTPALEGPRSRRSRWIDVGREDGTITVAAGFQDSAARPDGSRLAIHEYRLRARIEAGSGRIAELAVSPHVLPHVECPRAVLNLDRLAGYRLDQLRDQVPVILAKELGCTHLNDVLRALSAVPGLAAHLPGERTNND
jgi:Protein of unknown function (DUF2889)